MKSSFITALDSFRDYINWLPPLAVSLIILGAVGIFAFTISGFVTKTILTLPSRFKFQGKRTVFLQSILQALRTPVRIWFVMFLIVSALPATRFSSETKQMIAHLFLICFIIGFGYSLVKAIGLFSEAYLNKLIGNETSSIHARKHMTQIKVLRRLVQIIVMVIAVGAAMMTFGPVRQYGVSLFASAGAASLVVGLAVRPILTNLFGGIQIAITQPIRMGDLIIMNGGDWTWVEEISSTYVVLRSWDYRRYIVPISYFLETPFQNWTHNAESLTSPILLYMDYTASVEILRQKAEEIVKASPLYDGTNFGFQVTDLKDKMMTIRITAGTRNAGDCWDLGCDVREKMMDFVQKNHPDFLPKTIVKIPNASDMPPAPMVGQPM